MIQPHAGHVVGTGPEEVPSRVAHVTERGVPEAPKLFDGELARHRGHGDVDADQGEEGQLRITKYL